MVYRYPLQVVFKMKNSGLLILFIFFLGSCNVITDPIENIATPTDTTINSDTVLFSMDKKVIIEDFTGHKCGSCPEGGELLDAMQTNNKKNIIGIAIHAGLFASIASSGTMYIYDYRSTGGTEIYNFFGIDPAGIPNGLVNRRQNNSSKIIAPANWKSVSDKIISEPLDAVLKLKNNYDSTQKSISGKAEIKFLKTISYPVRLAIILTEDSIKSWQKDYRKTPSDVDNYPHNHVYRDAVNGTFGVDVTTGESNSGSIFSKSYQYNLNQVWKPENMHLIAYLYNASTYEIIQADKVDLLP